MRLFGLFDGELLVCRGIIFAPQRGVIYSTSWGSSYTNLHVHMSAHACMYNSWCSCLSLRLSWIFTNIGVPVSYMYICQRTMPCPVPKEWVHMIGTLILQ